MKHIYPDNPFALYDHEKKIQTNGWQTQNESKKIKRLDVHYQHSRYDAKFDQVPDELIFRELAYKLGSAILQDNLADYSKSVDQETFAMTYHATINVADPGVKYVNLDGTRFKVGDEEFTNEELIDAVKDYFAERFI